MKNWNYIKTQQDGYRFNISLNRPEKHNALFPGMISELHQALDEISVLPDVRFVVIEGEGASFCAGADIDWFSQSVNKSKADNWEEFLQMADLLKKIHELPQVTIAAAHKNVLGGANGLLAACDFAVAEKSTAFAFSEVKLGIIPATIAPFVAQRVSIQNMKKLFYSAERFWASEAQLIGLIDFLSDDGRLHLTVEKLINGLEQASPNALKECKKLLQKIASGEINTGSGEYTSAVLADLVQSAEGQEGLHAFLEKRLPAWRVLNAEEN